MFRKRKKEASEEAPQAQTVQAPVQTGGWHRSQLTTFDGKGNPTVITYSTDSVGRTVKSRGRGGKRGH